MKLFPVIIAALLFAGCGESLEQRLVGNWKVDANLTQLPKDIPPAQLPFIAPVLGSTLALRPDRSFDLDVPGNRVQGTWKLEGSMVTLAPSDPRLKRQLAQRPAAGLVVSPDARTLSFDVPGSGLKLIMVKAK